MTLVDDTPEYASGVAEATLDEELQQFAYDPSEGQNELPAEPQTAEHEKSPGPGRLRRLIGRAALYGGLGLATAAGVGAAGMLHQPAKAHVGGINLEITPTLDGDLTIEPLVRDVTIVKPLQHPPHGFGLRVLATGLETQELHDFNAERFSGLANLFADQKHIEAIGKHALVQHGIGWGEAGLLAGAGADLALFGFMQLLGNQRRRELAEVFGPNRPYIAALATIALFASLQALPNYAQHHTAAEADPIFADTALAGGHIEGTLGSLFREQALPPIINYLQENSDFQDKLSKNFELAVRPNVLLTADDQTTLIMHISDTHCNLGMYELFGQLAKRSNIQLVVRTGDDAIGGAPFNLDDLCINSINYHLRHWDRVVVEGNHRSADTISLEKKNKATVLDGNVTLMDRLLLVGESYQPMTSWGYSSNPDDPVAAKIEGDKLADKACDTQQGVDIIVSPTLGAARPALERGCARIGLSGGRYGNHLTWVTSADGQKLPLIKTGTSGGVEDGKLTIVGPLQQPATITLIKVSHSPALPTRLQEISFNPDASVVIGPITELNEGQETITSQLHPGSARVQ